MTKSLIGYMSAVRIHASIYVCSLLTTLIKPTKCFHIMVRIEDDTYMSSRLPGQTAKVTFKVIQGHWQWCHSIGHIRFPISLPLQLCLCCTVSEILTLISQNNWQNLKKSRDSEHIRFGSNVSYVHSYSSVSIST